MRLIDLTGKKFGRLTVVSRAENGAGGKLRWLCRCDCGREKTIQGGNLSNGHTISCGCVRKELHTVHGKSRIPEYVVWQAVKNRCLNPNATNHGRYGGRGITMCEKWRDDFSAFFSDMGPRPSPKHSIERNDNERGYEPDNCRWATATEQQANTRRSKR